MKPEFKIRKQRGKFAIEYLHVTKRFLLPDKKNGNLIYTIVELIDYIGLIL